MQKWAEKVDKEDLEDGRKNNKGKPKEYKLEGEYLINYIK